MFKEMFPNVLAHGVQPVDGPKGCTPTDCFRPRSNGTTGSAIDSQFVWSSCFWHSDPNHWTMFFRKMVKLWCVCHLDLFECAPCITEQRASASQMTAAKVLDVISRLPRCCEQHEKSVVSRIFFHYITSQYHSSCKLSEFALQFGFM